MRIHKLEIIDRFFLISVSAHFLMFSFLFLLNSSLFQSFKDGKKEKVLFAPSAIRVDVVEMPKLTLKEMQRLKLLPFKSARSSGAAPKAVPAPKAPEEKSPDALELEKKDQKNKLSELLKNLSEKNLAPEKVNKKKDEEGPVEGDGTGDSAEEVKNLLLAGNKLSKGTAITGAGGNGEVSEFALYVEVLLSYIRPHWKLPSHLGQQKLKCRIRLYLTGQGEIRDVEVNESSGVTLYDEKALDAVRMSAPFPPPPEGVAERVSEGEIILGFPL